MSTLLHPSSFPNEAGPSSSPVYCPSSSSPNRLGGKGAIIAGETARTGILPLRAAKTIALNRRGVYFSPRNDTKYFNSDDSILPSLSKDAPPPSIRSYADIENDSTAGSSSPAPYSDTPLSVRGILKQRAHQILLAASVEEGTLSNKEVARLKVSGRRPKLVARDSYQLAILRTAAADGPTDVEAGKGKGKEKAIEEMPASDDSTSSEEVPEQLEEKEGSSEIDEEVEEDGPLSTAALVNIILDGAEDLLTLEEAYSTLVIRLRQRIPTDGSNPAIADMESDIQLSITPIRDEAPAMVRAMLRDLQRLLGKVPNSDVPLSEASSSPFRGLMPLRDSTPVNRRLTPSPTPIPQPNKRYSPDNKAVRQGYTESEVKYRREASGVGAAALRFLAFTLHTPQLYGCFSEADLTSLLDQILVVPRTPRLPTPNPKRTYYLSIVVLAQMKIPVACVVPLREKIARAVESALTDSLGGPPGQVAKDGTGQVKKEAYHAVNNLFSTYPSVFFQHYTDLLAPCLRGLSAASAIPRNKAASAVAFIASTKLNLLADTSSRDEWARHKSTAQRMEHFVVSHFKSPVKIPGKTGPVYGVNGEKRTEWHDLEKVFKDTVGSVGEVQWACATWAVVVTLMGSAYASSGLANAFDHIMDPSTNSVRPLLARIAWSHAVHAYLSSGIVTSISEDNSSIVSYRPFSTTAAGDYTERLKTIQLPVELALSLALDSSSVSRIEEDGRWKWHRSEKPKKFDWMVTSGLASAAVVYAYTGTALHHQDQPAKEMTAISGLPSSDGMPIPEAELEHSKMDRLDKIWDRVVKPMVKSLGNLCAVDRLKMHGWQILDSITAPQSDVPSTWSLDRLLSTRYLMGEAFEVEKDFSMETFLDHMDKDAVRASEIPSWGATWTAGRLDKLLDSFEDILTGIVGWNDTQTLRWIKDGDAPIIPLNVSRIWSNLLRALESTRTVDPATYLTGLSLITRHLLQVFNRDPTGYVPISSLALDGTYDGDVDALRIHLFGHLFDSALMVLGRDAVGATRIPKSTESDPLETIIFGTAFGADAAQQPTMAGILLGQLLRNGPFSFPLSERAMNTYKSVVGKVLDVGSIQGYSGKLLGDMTNHMPFIFQDQEDLQLVVWRLLAQKWVEAIDLQPSTTSSSTNHTGALLVSLLSCPFRAVQITSSWHQRANSDDLAAWQALLKVTVLRFRAKRVGANLGVLETLAGHLTDFLEQGEKTASTTITLSCLASAASFITFVTPEAHHATHFQINENFVPTDFLTLISNALEESYPQAEITSSQDQKDLSQTAISPAVASLLEALREVVRSLKGEVVNEVISAIKKGVVVWLEDKARVANGELTSILDSLYVVLLDCLSGAIESGHIAVTLAAVDDLIDIFAPRLSVAQTPAVPQSFQRFWQNSFSSISAEEFSEDVRLFLQDVLAAVPGMITVPGLGSPHPLSEEESQAKFPHAHEFASQPTTSPAVLVDATEMEIDPENLLSHIADPDPTVDYDADVSQSVSQGSKKSPTRLDLEHAVSIPSVIAEEDSSMEVEQGGDVFGPTHSTITIKSIKGKKGKGKKRGRQSRPLGDAESMPETKRKKTAVDPEASHSLPSLQTTALVPASSSDIPPPEDDDCIFVYESPAIDHRGDSRGNSPTPHTTAIRRRKILSSSSHSGGQGRAPRPSILSSAKGWLARVPSFGLFSPTNIFEPESRPAASENTSQRQLTEEDRSNDEVEKAESTVDIEEVEAMGSDVSFVQPQEESAPKGQVPVTNTQTPAEDPIESSQSQSRSPIGTRARRKGVQETREVTPAPSSKERKRGRAARPTPSSSGTTEPVIHVVHVVDDDEDEEDELLLSPESARRRRREEEQSIAAAMASPPAIKSPKIKRTRSRTKISEVHEVKSGESQESGRFDDASETSLIPHLPDSLPTPVQRTAQQVRVLSMIHRATEFREAVESLDLDGVVDLLRNVDRLRAAAQANLEKRAAEQRAAKRARRG